MCVCRGVEGQRGDGPGQKDLFEELGFVSRCSDGFKKNKRKTVTSLSNLAFKGIILAALWKKDWRGTLVNMEEVSRQLR